MCVRWNIIFDYFLEILLVIVWPGVWSDERSWELTILW